MIEMHVAGIGMDTRSGQPVLLLNDSENKRSLPIWIGVPESIAIGNALENIKHERPMTHDLILSTIEQLGYKVVHVEVNEMESSTYLATIRLAQNDEPADFAKVVPIDARPSDAIAIALRAKCPIYVAPQIVEMGTIPAHSQEDVEKAEKEDAEAFSKFVENLKASDFNRLNS
jgi:bifunctional DNase/RNase